MRYFPDWESSFSKLKFIYMPTIKIIRKNTNTDILREYKLFVDDNKLDGIARNEIKEFDIASGSHSIATTEFFLNLL